MIQSKGQVKLECKRLEVTTNVKSPICLYRYEICLSGDVYIEEYILLGTLSPAAASSRATIEMQHNDIQHLDHEIEADLEYVRQIRSV